MTTFTHDLEIPNRALSIAAHPDDTEFGCGGTLAKWAAAGCEVSLLVCTDGSKGTWNHAADPAMLVATRHDEQREAARRLGAIGEVIFLDVTDGELEADIVTRGVVASWIRRLKPDVLLGHDPWKRYRLHPDHRNAGLLTIEGLVAARDPHFFPEQDLDPHRPTELLLFEADEPNHVEEISRFLDTKVAALEAHVSQFETTMGIADDVDGSQTAAFRESVRREASAAAALDVDDAFSHAEAFARIDAHYL